MASTAFTANVALRPIGSLLSTIFKVATTIRRTVEQMKDNDTKCDGLSRRIDRIVGLLKKKAPEDFLSETMERELRSFAEFLKECLALIEKYVKGNYLKRIWNNKEYCRQFSKMDEEFSHFATDLTFGMALDISSAVRSSRNSVEQVCYNCSLTSCSYSYHERFNFSGHLIVV